MSTCLRAAELELFPALSASRADGTVGMLHSGLNHSHKSGILVLNHFGISGITCIIAGFPFCSTEYCVDTVEILLLCLWSPKYVRAWTEWNHQKQAIIDNDMLWMSIIKYVNMNMCVWLYQNINYHLCKPHMFLELVLTTKFYFSVRDHSTMNKMHKVFKSVYKSTKPTDSHMLQWAERRVCRATSLNTEFLDIFHQPDCQCFPTEGSLT